MRKVQVVVTLTTDKEANELADMLLDGHIDKAGALSIEIVGPNGSIVFDRETSWPS